MDLKQKARELVGEAMKALAEEGEKGSIPGPVIGWLIKKGEIKKPGGKRRRKRIGQVGRPVDLAAERNLYHLHRKAERNRQAREASRAGK